MIAEKPHEKILRETRERLARQRAEKATAPSPTPSLNGSTPAFDAQLADLLSLATRGLKIFRLVENAKVPEAGSRGHTDATTDPETIRRLLAESPRANWGLVPGPLPTGEHGFIQDLDVRRDPVTGEERTNGITRLRQWCDEHDVDFTSLTTQGLVVRTGGGGLQIHLISPRPIRQGTHLLGAKDEKTGIDTRTEKGYGLAPGSRVDGRAYTFVSNAERLIAPPALVDALAAPSPKPATPPTPPVEIDADRARARFIAHVHTAEPAVQGQGGDTLTVKIAMKGKDFGLDDATCFDVLAEYWNDRCQPPWPVDELRVKVRNAFKYGKESPGSAAPEVEFSVPIESTTSAADAARLDPLAPWLEEMRAENFIVNQGREVLVFRPNYDPVLRRRKYDKHTFAALEQLYQNDLVNVVVANGDVKQKNKATAYLNHPQRRQYLKGARYAPDQTLPDGMFNLDMGFGIDPKPGSWVLMQRHLRDVICSHDQDSYRYVMGWMADAVQHRGDRALTALALRGARGVGKGILGNSLLRIFGQHGLYISNSEQLVGKFNSHLEDASFVFGDECFFPGDKKHLSTLKALITEGTIPIEAKFESPRMAKNCLHIFFASNEAFIVPAGRDERRFAVFDVSDRHKQNRAYFDPLRQELGLDADTDGQGTGAAAMLYDLLHYDLSAFDITKVPQTTALLDQKLHGMSATAKWLLDCLHHGRFEESSFGEGDQWETTAVTLVKASVYETYRRYSKISKEYRAEETGVWMKELKKMLHGCVQDSRPRAADGTRPRLMTFQTLAKCRAAFETWIGHSIEWRTDAEQDDDRARELAKEVFD